MELVPGIIDGFTRTCPVVPVMILTQNADVLRYLGSHVIVQSRRETHGYVNLGTEITPPPEKCCEEWYASVSR
jgi:hypothetical protein